MESTLTRAAPVDRCMGLLSGPCGHASSRLDCRIDGGPIQVRAFNNILEVMHIGQIEAVAPHTRALRARRVRA